jgi:hypothetical protein
MLKLPNLNLNAFLSLSLSADMYITFQAKIFNRNPMSDRAIYNKLARSVFGTPVQK